MKNIIYVFIALFAFALVSCDTFSKISIEKRHFRKGFYVNVRDEQATESASSKEKAVAADKVNPVNASVENTAAVVENSAQRPAAGVKENVAPKKYFNHFPATRMFKKGDALFHEKSTTTSAAAKPGNPADDDGDSAVALFLLIILAIILPPLAVLLADGVGVNFLVDLIFWLLGFGFVIFVPGAGVLYLGIFGLIAIIYALLVVFDAI